MTDYDFRSLSPIDFEALVRDVLSAEFELPFETFAVGPDGGIDLRHTGQDRTIIVQCKHRPAATKAQTIASAKKELGKWASETPTEYFFITSASLSPDAVDEVSEALGKLSPHPGHVWARGRLNTALVDHPNIERRHFKLWLSSSEVFDRILASGEWERSEALVRHVRDRVRLYVHTPSYDEAFKLVEDQRVVLICGAPGVGKSTMAEMLLLTYWNAGWRVVNIVSDISEAWPQLRDPDQRTIFYYDDFLGQSSALELQKNEGNDLALFIKTLQSSSSGNARLVMTTREQILNAAVAGGDDRIRRAVEHQKRLSVEMNDISRIDKARILFNHLYFSYDGSFMLEDLSRDTRYRSVVDHANFNPRVLESVVLVKRPETIDALYSALASALDHPDLIWRSSFEQLSIMSVRILLQLAIEPGRELPATTVESLASSDDPRDYVNALRVLEGSWIRIEGSSTGADISLYDPSRRDFLLDQLENGPLFLQAVDDSTSLRQVAHLIGNGSRPKIRLLVNRFQDHIDEVVAACLSDELDRIDEEEARLASLGNRVEHFQKRSHLMRSAVQLLILLPTTELLRELLIPALDYLDEDFNFMRRPAASSIFRLASALFWVHEDWALERARQAVIVGLQGIEDTEEIRSYANLELELRDSVDAVEVEQALDRAFDAELDGIGQQSDRDLMSTWLDEVESLADDLGVSVDTDSLRQTILEMPESLDVDPKVIQRVVDLNNDDESDAGLANLFARLGNND